MAIHGVSWVLGAHMLFGNQDFIITTEGGFVQAPTTVEPLHFTGLAVIAEALEELKLHAPEAHTPGVTSSLASIMGRYSASSAPS